MRLQPTAIDDSKIEPDSAGICGRQRRGYIRHWLVVGPHSIPYAGPAGAEDVLRCAALDRHQGAPTLAAALHAPGPFGQPWRFYYPGKNFFVEHSAFYVGLTVIDSYAFVEIEARANVRRAARLWVSGLADLWVNNVPITRFAVTRYMYPDSQKVTLPLRRGINRICVRLQCFGVRDTRMLFGLQLLTTTGLAVRVPGCAPLIAAANWLDGIQTDGRDAVTSARPAPPNTSVSICGGTPLTWPAESSRLPLANCRPFQLTVAVAAANQTLHRALEIPANRAGNTIAVPADVRTARLEFIAGCASGGNPPGRPRHGGARRMLARRLLGRQSESDASDFAESLARVEGREDCADFALATLLRLESLGLATATESAAIRRAALGFRYWSDEPGTDAMCFWSENHSLLFHGCQLIAGRLYPAAIFTNSNRIGTDHARLGAARCRAWLDRIEPRGFEEFNSGTYLPITIGALLNVVDFGGDAAMARRAAALVDGLYATLAIHAFGGIVVSPQGRVYRNVLYPEESGTQALLSDATATAPPEFLSLVGKPWPDTYTGDWLVYPASSPGYRPPPHLAALTRKPIATRYRQGGAEIVLHKTSAFLLTSLSVPGAPSAGRPEDAADHLQPGRAGYQQHLWQATLGPACHVFVNHPGGSFDHSPSRPGYWYGNGVLPRLRQREGILQAIYNLPAGAPPGRDQPAADRAWPPGARRAPFDLHPIPFTHVHWPTDAFDHQAADAHWLFGQKNTGYIGVWCSAPLQAHNDVLTGREFRAWADRCAWVAVCGSRAEHGSLASFSNACLSRRPEFDPPTLSLTVTGEEALTWNVLS